LSIKDKPTINISIQDEYAFRFACTNGHTEIVKWLTIIKPTIDVSAINDWGFRSAYSRGFIDILYYLANFDPNKYSIEIKNNKLIGIINNNK
jgi:hypothetical protein